jgi:hypothetical protein
MFLNMNLENLNSVSDFTEVTCSVRTQSNAVCESGEYGQFENVLSSTRLLGFDRIESYFVRARLRERQNLIECGVLDTECSCPEINPSEEASFHKS